MIDLDCEIHSKQQISRPPSGGLGQVDQSQHSNRDTPIIVTYNKDNQVIAEKNSKTGDKIKYVYDDNGNLIEKRQKENPPSTATTPKTASEASPKEARSCWPQPTTETETRCSR